MATWHNCQSFAYNHRQPRTARALKYVILLLVFLSIFRSEERQYCWNCNSGLNPRCGRRLSRQLARSVSVPPTRNIHQSVPCIRSKSMPYRKKDTSKMPTSECIIQYANHFKCTVHDGRVIFLICHFINPFVCIYILILDFENSSIKTCFSLSSLHPSTANVESRQQAAQRPYNSLTKKIKWLHTMIIIFFNSF